MTSRALVLTSALALPLIAAEPDPRPWRYSVAALTAASVADAHSSWGHAERNPILAGADGRFGARGVAIKCGLVAAVVGVQYIALRRWPRLGRRLAVINFSAAGATAGAAARNYSMEVR